MLPPGATANGSELTPAYTSTTQRSATALYPSYMAHHATSEQVSASGPAAASGHVSVQMVSAAAQTLDEPQLGIVPGAVVDGAATR